MLLMASTNLSAREQVRVLVVGGIAMSGVWQKLKKAAEVATGLEIITVQAAPKESIIPSFVKGNAELMLIHGSDETYHLQAEGLAAPLQAWAYNEHVIVGPAEDPAGVGGAKSGVEAMRRIYQANAAMVGFRDPGSFSIMHHLWRLAGLQPRAKQQLPDESERPQEVVLYAAKHRAYVIVGHIPVAFGKIPMGDYKVLLKNDPIMRRVYVVVKPGWRHPASPEAKERAHRLATYLLSPEGQEALVKANHPSMWISPIPSATTTSSTK